MSLEPVPLHFFERRSHTEALIDRFSRALTYLRISVTDRCNMRCDYCRPAADAYQSEPRTHVLSFEEIERIVSIAVGLGVSKVRITGGEPLVRRDLPQLMQSLSAMSGIKDLAMSTNATLLKTCSRAARGS